MALPATDVFTGANTDPLSANWTVDAGSFWIWDNSVRGTTNSAMNIARHNVETFSNDQYVEADCVSLDAADLCGLLLRGGAGTGIVVYVYDGGWYCYNVPAGEGTAVSIGGSAAISDGDRMRATIVGVTLRAYKNGVEVGSGFDATGWASSGKAGIAIYSNGTTALDNWEGGNVGGVPPAGRATVVSQAVARAAHWHHGRPRSAFRRTRQGLWVPRES